MIVKIKKEIKKIFQLQNKKKELEIIDEKYLNIDRRNILRTNNIQYIPKSRHRKGGKTSYAEWAHVIGIFQTLMYQNLKNKEANHILDIGCGTGLVAIASQHLVKNDGLYLGLDVIKENITFCEKQYKDLKELEFQHFEVNNEMYAKNQSNTLKSWDVDDNSIDMVTALSVWTHLNERDASFYFQEVDRVLKNGARAIITFFYLDKLYRESLEIRENKKGRYHPLNQLEWVFDTHAYQSKSWFYPKHLNIPENAIGLTEKGLEKLLINSRLKLVNYFPGNWKEKPGVYFQDVLIFEKF